jgi:hypothetical protein
VFQVAFWIGFEFIQCLGFTWCWFKVYVSLVGSFGVDGVSFGDV